MKKVIILSLGEVLKIPDSVNLKEFKKETK